MTIKSDKWIKSNAIEHEMIKPLNRNKLGRINQKS